MEDKLRVSYDKRDFSSIFPAEQIGRLSVSAVEM